MLLLLIIVKVYPQVEDIRFDHILPSDGLIHDIVTQIVQDKDGFIWVGTEDGLMKYDSYTLTSFKNDPDNSSTLRDDWISRILCDSKGRLWIGTALGLDRYDKRSGKFIHYTLPLPETHKGFVNSGITILYEDLKGDIFVSTPSGGLLIYDEKKNVFYKNEFVNNLESKLSALTRAMFQDSEGNYWIGTYNGLLKWQSEKEFRYYKKSLKDNAELSDSLIFDICEDINENIWVATGFGLNVIHKETGRVKKYFPSARNNLCDAKILDLYKDSKKNIWIGTYVGLNKYLPETDTFLPFKNDINNPYSLSANRIYALLEDRAGTLWIGTYKGGVSKIDPRMNRFTYYGHYTSKQESLSGDIVRAIHKDKSGNLWVGIDGDGLNKYDYRSGTFRHFKHNPHNPNSILSDYVLSIISDKTGNIWAGTYGGGISKYIPETGSFKNYKPTKSNGLTSSKINVIYEDREGEFWVGTDGSGLFKFYQQTGKFVQFDLIEKYQSVHSIFQDSDGYLWIGNFGGGLYKLNKKKNEIKKFMNEAGNPKSLSSSVIYDINEDRNKNIWVSTFRGGLNLYNKETETFTSFKEKDGLPSNYVKAAIADKHNNLWLPTNKGLVRFNPVTHEIKTFSEKDGLRSGDFLSGAYLIDKEGVIYAGGSKGFVSFNPETFKESNYIPPVVITNFKIFDEPYKIDIPLIDLKELTLDYDQNFFSFEFAALEYSAFDKNQYSFMLTGIDKDWINSGTRRFASYTHLDPGKYIFKVKAANNDGIWGNEAISILITITPPFWLTWWFRALTLLMIIALVYFLYRYRLNKLLEIERIKNRLASDLHDDIASNLSSIAMFSQIVHDESKKSNNTSPMMDQMMEKITSMSQESVASIREIIWAIDPKPESVFDLLMRAKDTFVTQCRAKGISFNLNIPDKEHLPVQNLAPEERKNIWLLMKEAINNSVKHSCASEISVHAFYKNNHLNIIILDNGKGFDTSTESKGKGMGTMKKRAENLKGEITIVSNSESGTIINLHIKI